MLAQQNFQMPVVEGCAAPATELIVQVDGGHIPIRDQQKRSFEALAAIAYKSESIKNVDKNHRQIVNKNCMASAKNDQLKTIKAYLINAAKKQGFARETKVIGLADNARNC